MNSCLYEGEVIHIRRSPVPHRFRSRLSLLYLDLAELDTVFRGRLLWSAGRRPAWAWFRRKDHFGDPAVPLDVTVRNLVAEVAGVRLEGPVRVLTHPRYGGFVFNPVSFCYCFDGPDAAEPSAIVAEVTNTPWGQRHCYVLTRDQFSNPPGCDRKGMDEPGATGPRARGPEAHETGATSRESAGWLAKEFHVSPFMRLQQEYLWRLTPPGEELTVSIQSREGENRLFGVTMQLNRRPINSFELLRAVVRYPLQTARVVGQIYWQALRLWWKGVPFVPHPFKGLPHGNQSGGPAEPAQRRPEITGPATPGDEREGAAASPQPMDPVDAEQDCLVSQHAWK